MVELDVPWVAEVISERFDGAIELMTENSIIYGGAVRDALAGLPLLGDLDILVTDSDSECLKQAFNNSSKWISTDSTLPITMSGKKKPYQSLLPDIESFQPVGVNMHYKNAYEQPVISKVNTFQTIGGLQVQLVTFHTNEDHALPMSSITRCALYPATFVDLKCCSLVMLSNGKVFETVKGSYQDCIDRVLRTHIINKNLDLDIFTKRVIKLEKNGWKSKINMRSVVRTVNKLKAAENKKTKTKCKKIPSDLITVAECYDKDSRFAFTRLRIPRNSMTAFVPRNPYLVEQVTTIVNNIAEKIKREMLSNIKITSSEQEIVITIQPKSCATTMLANLYAAASITKNTVNIKPNKRKPVVPTTLKKTDTTVPSYHKWIKNAYIKYTHDYPEGFSKYTHDCHENVNDRINIDDTNTEIKYGTATDILEAKDSFNAYEVVRLMNADLTSHKHVPNKQE